MMVIFVCVWDVIIYTCIINVCQMYLSSFQENIKMHCFILNVKLKINSLLKICEVNISKKIFIYTLLVSELHVKWSMYEHAIYLTTFLGSYCTPVCP